MLELHLESGRVSHQLVYVRVVNHGYGGLDGDRGGGGVCVLEKTYGVGRMSGDAGAIPE